MVSNAKCCGILRCWPRVSQAMKHRRIGRDWVFSICGFELGLPAFQLPMFSKCDSLPKGYLWDMFVFRNPLPPFLLGIPSIQSLQEAWVPESGSTFRQLCITLWLHHAHPFVAAAENSRKSQSYAEKQRVWSGICGLQDLLQMQWLCSQLCYVTAANQWTVVEIELLAIVGCKCGCQPFRCPCWQNVTQCRKDICGTCLFSGIHSRHSFWEFPASNPYKKLEFPRRQYVPPALHYVMVASCPSLRCSCRKR